MDLLSPHGGHTLDHPIIPSTSPSASPFGFCETRCREGVEEQVLPKATQKVKCQSRWGDRPDANQSLVAWGRK